MNVQFHAKLYVLPELITQEQKVFSMPMHNLLMLRSQIKLEPYSCNGLHYSDEFKNSPDAVKFHHCFLSL